MTRLHRRRRSHPSRLSRRHFTLGALSLPCGPLLSGLLDQSLARAEGPAAHSEPAARRFVGVYAPHGIAQELWLPGPGFDIGYAHCSLQPFDDPVQFERSFKDRIVVVEGVDLSAGIRRGTVGHEGARVLFTGSAAGTRSPSIDQYLAVECQLGAATPHSSLVLGVGDRTTEIGYSLSYDRAGRPLPKRIDPDRVYGELFAELLVPREAQAAALLLARRKRRASALDLLGEQVRELTARLPPELSQSLDQHLTAHRELERRLAHWEAHCQAPQRPTKVAQVERSRGAAAFSDTITDLLIDLLAHAMACDLTRFATLLLGDLSRTQLLADLPDDIHFGVSHRYRGRYPGQPGRPETWLPLARQNRYGYQKVARLLMRLQQHGLLDETLVYASSDMGDPARHSSRRVPTLLAGAGLEGGRHLRIGPEHHPANNHLLVAICRAFGVERDDFGVADDPAIVNGPLPGLWA